MFVISGESTGRQAMTKVEGIGSRMQVEVFMPEVMEDRFEAVISVNEVSGWLDNRGEAGSGSGVVVEEVASSVCMVSILD